MSKGISDFDPSTELTYCKDFAFMLMAFGSFAAMAAENGCQWIKFPELLV